jgi:hypothetical protein
MPEPEPPNPLPAGQPPLDPAVVSPVPDVPPDPVAPPRGNPGEKHRFIGRLVRIECRQDDVRLLLKPETIVAAPPSGGLAPEAFTGILEAVAAKRFEKELVDYRTVEEAVSDRFRSTFGEVSFLSVAASLPAQGFFEQAEREAHLVEVVGSYTTPAESLKRRLAANSFEKETAPTASSAVIALDSVMRVGEPQTLAQAGHRRLPDTFSTDIASNRSYASALLRSPADDLPVKELAGLLFAMGTGEHSLMFIPDGTLLGMNVKPGNERFAGERPADIVEAEFRAGLMRGSQFARARGRFRFDGEFDAEGTPCVRPLGPLRAEPIADIAAFMASGTPPGGAGAAGPAPGMSEFPPGVGPGTPGEIPERVPGTIVGRPGPGADVVPNPGEVADNGSGEPFYVIGYSFGGSRTVGVQFKVVQGRDNRDENISFIEQQGYKVLKPIRSFDDVERAQTYIDAQQNRR